MELSTLTSVAGWSVSAVSGSVTIMAVFIAVYAAILQKSMSKKLKEEIAEKAHNKLDKALKNPSILKSFINTIVENDEFKNRFSNLIDVQIENILDSRDIADNRIYSDSIDNDDIIIKFKTKKEKQ